MIRNNARRPKKTLHFPLWTEALLVLAAGVMAAVEGMHGSWFWAVIFGLSAMLFGISLGARAATGDKHGRP